MSERDEGWSFCRSNPHFPFCSTEHGDVPAALLDEKPYRKDSGKPRTDLLPFRALLGLAEVYRFGAAKYGDRNWEQYADEMNWGEMLAPALRHVFKWAAGAETDEESGLHHLLHAAWNMLALYEMVTAGRGVDDRSTLKGEK